MFQSSFVILTALFASVCHVPDVAKLDAKAGVVQHKDMDITGYYTCSGREGVGKNYTGVAVISKKDDVYTVQWIIGTGGAAFYGVAVRQGDSFAASWAIPGDKGGVVRGVNLYRIESGPRLVGRWATMPGDGTLRTETLTFLKKMDE
jgi:hypothetical protein